ncbi:hypothetical protein F4677DRAFT_364702 [Hypoxylon crocopeplum]|nr:hypothetical protein F4677DRAFT_364702 [Hypoxylon crocopeplum]
MVAMAYPPFGGPGAPLTRETIVDGAPPPYPLTQNSSHSNNFVFGDIPPGDFEHKLVPIMKLIDFGRGRLEANYEDAHIVNIWGAAYVLMRLALVGRPNDYFRDLPTSYYVAHGELIETQACDAFLKTFNMDHLLRDIIARCMARDRKDIPSLNMLLNLCEHVVDTRTLEDFDNAALSEEDRRDETDEVIDDLIKRSILDADIVDAPLEIERLTANTQMGTTMLGLMASHPTRLSVRPPETEGPNQTLFEGFAQTLEGIRNNRDNDVD